MTRPVPLAATTHPPPRDAAQSPSEDAALHVFDMDGTLLPGTTASLEIARAVGGEQRLLALEEDFRNGLLDTRAFAVALHDGWGDLTADLVAAAFAAAPKLVGIRRTVDALHGRGHHAAVITMSPDFFVRHFEGYGFDAVVGSRFPVLPFAHALDVGGVLTFHDKPRIVADLCRRLHVQPSRVVAYGDSQSDVPLFQVAGASVAVNADTHVRSLASTHYRGRDLYAAYRLGLRALGTVA